MTAIELSTETVAACWRCGGYGGYLDGDEWQTCPICRGEFALPLWFLRWRTHVAELFNREDWMCRHVIDSIRLWAEPAREAVAGYGQASLWSADGTERLWLVSAGGLLVCSCDVFQQASVCLHVPAQEWARRSLAGGFGKPVWGLRLAVDGGLVYPRDLPALKFPVLREWLA